MRLRLRLAAALCALLAALALAAPASAQIGGGGSDLGSPEPQEVAPEPVDPTDDGWEAWQTLLVTLAGVVLIIGIGFVIVGDARRRAPASDDRGAHRADAAHVALGEGEDTRHTHSRETKARARKKQKIAKQSRKRNRQRG
jgi:ABC-type Fe3+ transport system permease subunit